MQFFTITVRTATHVTRYFAIAISAHSAFMNAAEAQGDALCGITVAPAKADA